ETEETVTKSIDDDPPVRNVVRTIVADLMQRRPGLSNVCSVQVSGTFKSDITKDIVNDLAGEILAEAQTNDPVIGEFVKLLLQNKEQPCIDTLQLTSETTKVLWSQWFRFIVRNGVVYRLWFGRNGEPSRMQLLAPRGIREDIVKLSHGGMCGGH